jgi:hypothetical protein
MGWRKHVYLSLFSFAKSENKRAEQVMPGLDTSGRVKEVEKGCGWMNVVQILSTHVCKQKNDTC